MKIAVCDDDTDVIEELRKILTEINKNDEFEAFTSAEALLDTYIMGKKYDLLFLDIVMGKMNGLELAAEIRKKDKEAMVICISSHNEYMEEAFDVDAMKYLLKPIRRDQILFVYQRCSMRYRETHGRIPFKIWENDGTLQIRNFAPKEIMFLEAHDKALWIYKYDGQIIKAIGPLKDHMDALRDRGFVIPHRGYMVNLQAIDIVRSDEIILHAGDDGQIKKLPLSQGNRKDVENAFIAYGLSGSD